MTRRCFLGLLPASFGALAIPPLDAGRTDTDGVAEREFLRAVDRYMRVRRRLDQRLPPLELSGDADRIQIVTDRRAAAIRQARSRARVGDIFTPAVRDVFRGRIRAGFALRAGAAAALLDEMAEGGEPWTLAVVNGRFSWSTAAATPPFVLAALPPLPPDLQYRFVGRDLVLVDIAANFIVDILPDAIEPPTSGETRHG